MVPSEAAAQISKSALQVHLHEQKGKKQGELVPTTTRARGLGGWQEGFVTHCTSCGPYNN